MSEVFKKLYIKYCRFWYGGSGGNNNNFNDKETCEEICVDPIGRDACELPQVAGPCDGYYTRWSYDAKSKNCKQFQYGGCLGNNNRVSIYVTYYTYNLWYE